MKSKEERFLSLRKQKFEKEILFKRIKIIPKNNTELLDSSKMDIPLEIKNKIDLSV